MKFYLQFVIFSLLITYLPAIIAQISFHKKTVNKAVKVLAWTIPTLFLVVFFLFRFSVFNPSHQSFLWFMWLFMTLFLPANIIALFTALDALFKRIFGKKIKLRQFVGYPLGIIIAGGLIWGAADRYHVEVRRVEITSDQLPAAFDGLKLVQISDVHLGNLSNAEAYLTKVTDSINAAQPDLILLTGDLVNLTGNEGDGLDAPFLKLHATLGKYAILGNHDYGDYITWDTPEAKVANLNSVKALYKRFGFDLLLDEHRTITRDSAQISIVGVENCGVDPFPCYGNLTKALDSLSTTCNILLSHDPTHWRAEVLQHPELTLMLAGHTHGAQLGIDAFGVKWSPSHWIFKEWDGLYQQAGQFLFVNRGLGYVGIPFRLGMRPEITVITLRTGN